jgi:mannitol operon repressor
MEPEDSKYFAEFLAEFQSETDRGAALVGAALIDERLERLLSAHLAIEDLANDLVRGNDAPLGTFSARIKMAYALGLITELEFQESNIIRRIRNEFAHAAHGMTFKNQRLADLCGNLKAHTPDNAHFEGVSRQQFINSVVLLSLALWYRPEYAAPFKSQLRQWKWQLSPGP